MLVSIVLHIDKENVSPDIKFKTEKFEPKVLAWLAISSKGHSDAVFAPKNCNVNEVYQKECIRSRLVPFVRERHTDGDYLFWPNLASHYAKDTITLLAHENINFLPKDANPPMS